MSECRGSYLKTVVAASGAALIGGLTLAWAMHSARLGDGAWYAPRLVVWSAVEIGLGGLLGVIGAMVAGGLIALRRDTLQTRGVPYASTAPREWLPGATVRMLRRAVRAVAGRTSSSGRLALRPGEVVEIRSLDEILATLDERGTHDSLPFMPEMAALCGQQARVFRVVAKIHDYVGRTGLRRMHDTVLLEALRCDGSAHGGCQASCHLLWKEAWLKRSPSLRRTASVSACPAVEPLVHLSRRVADDGTTRYVCQMTQVADGTTPLGWGDPRHYLRDLCTGNVRLGPFLTGVCVALFNWVQVKRGGASFPARPANPRKTSPHEALDLRPGEQVAVKSLADIEATLNSNSRNRGLWFDPDLIRYCGGEYRVLARVERLINERTGSLVTLTIPSVILEGVTATGEYLAFAPQNDAIFWREIWLRRVVRRTTTAAGYGAS